MMRFQAHTFAFHAINKKASHFLSAWRGFLCRALRAGVHRVYLCEADSMKPSGVITLTDILRLVCDAAEEGSGNGGAGGGEEEEQGKAAA